MPVHLCESLCGQSRSRCQSVITKHKMENCSDLFKGIYFVTTNPAEPPHELKLVASLCGGMLVTPEWFCSQGCSGLGLRAVAAISIARRLWVSAHFRRDHPAAAAQIDRALHLPESKWRACSKDAFATAALKSPPSMQVLALMTTTAASAVATRNAFDLDGFLDFVFKINQGASSIGAG